MISTVAGTPVQLTSPIDFETGLVTIVADLRLNGTANCVVNVKDLTATDGWLEIHQAHEEMVLQEWRSSESA